MDIFITMITWTLALYGLFEIIKNIVYICTCTKLNSKGIYLLVAVKDQEENIEYFLINVLFRIIYSKEEIKNLIIIDLNSKDNTKKIIEKLQKEYEQINLLSWKECKELIENIEEN